MVTQSVGLPNVGDPKRRALPRNSSLNQKDTARQICRNLPRCDCIVEFESRRSEPDHRPRATADRTWATDRPVVGIGFLDGAGLFEVRSVQGVTAFVLVHAITVGPAVWANILDALAVLTLLANVGRTEHMDAAGLVVLAVAAVEQDVVG